VLGGVYVLTILYLPMGLMGIPSRLRQRFASQGKKEGAKKLATKPS
jgi:branched-chain amino acid transport system permease protein